MGGGQQLSDSTVDTPPARESQASLFGAFDEPRGFFAMSIWSGDGFERWDWDDWRSEIAAFAASLRASGVGPGDRVACILTNCAKACAAVPGIWAAGGTVVSMPTIARGMQVGAYLDQLRRICVDVQPVVLLMEEQFAANLPEDALPGIQVSSYESLASRTGGVEFSPPHGEEEAFVQYSSGSTSDPRGCVLSADAVLRHIDILAERLRLDPPNECGITWLPLSHDMGLFGGLMMSFLRGMPLCLSTPQRFLRSPGTWFDDAARFGGTITAAPNFALELAIRAARVEQPAPFPMRKCVLGGERVEASSIASAVQALSASGLAPSSLAPAYGMAEAVLAVTMTAIEEPPTLLELDSAPLLDNEVRGAELVEDWDAPPAPGRTRLVSAGRPLSGVAVWIDGEGPVGEICVSSPSLASGYLGDETATRERFRDGEFHSGDIGFVQDGQLYIVGRLDDMITTGGRNIFARDVEVAMAGEAQIRPGSCVLVTLPTTGGAGKLLALAEPAQGVEDLGAVVRSLADAAREATGLRLDECMLLAPGSLPKTPSGKTQRFRCRQLLEAELLQPLAQVAG